MFAKYLVERGLLEELWGEDDGSVTVDMRVPDYVALKKLGLLCRQKGLPSNERYLAYLLARYKIGPEEDPLVEGMITSVNAKRPVRIFDMHKLDSIQREAVTFLMKEENMTQDEAIKWAIENPEAIERASGGEES